MSVKKELEKCSIENEIGRIVSKIKDTVNEKDLKFTIYGDPKSISVFGDRVNWVVKYGDTIGCSKLIYALGTITIGGVEFRVISSDQAVWCKGLYVTCARGG